MTQIEIHQFACLKDNYGVLIHDPEGGQTASIDAPDAAAVKAALRVWPVPATADTVVVTAVARVTIWPS